MNDKQKHNSDDVQLEDEETSAPSPYNNISSDSSDESDSNSDLDIEVEDFEDTDEEGKELGSLAKIKKLREQLKTALAEKQEYLTSWQKEKAEFINIRRRDEESKQEFLKFATVGLVEELLPVLDSFDMAMGNKEAWNAVSAEWRAGVETIYNQFKGILSKNGVEAFGQIGDVADPAKFHMIGVDETDDSSKDNTVSAVLQKGYMMKERVLRPAMVRVFHVK